MDARFFVDLDSVVGFRQLSHRGGPEPIAAAVLAELAGADGLVIGLTEGERGMRPRDLAQLRKAVHSHMCVDLPPTADVVSAAFDIRPDRVTLVPEGRDRRGGGGGLDAHVLKDALKKHVGHLTDADVEVGVRVDPALEQIKALHRLNADVAVLNTHRFVSARGVERRQELARIVDAASLAERLGIKVAVSGGLDLDTAEQLAQRAKIDEFHVGHACMARALLKGLEGSISDFITAIERGGRARR